MRYLLCLILIKVFMPFSIYSQSTDCSLVQSILEEDIVQKYLEIKKITPDVIIIIDTTFSFKECQEDFFLKKSKVIISNNYKKSSGNRIPYKEGKPIKGSRVLIDIFGVEKKAKKVKVYLGQIESGRYGYIILKKKRKRYKLCKYSLGQT